MVHLARKRNVARQFQTARIIAAACTAKTAVRAAAQKIIPPDTPLIPYRSEKDANRLPRHGEARIHCTPYV